MPSEWMVHGSGMGILLQRQEAELESAMRQVIGPSLIGTLPGPCRAL